MERVDLSKFYEETETPETKAYDHALEIEHIVAEEMLKQGLSKTELAKRMGVTVQRLSKLLNTRPNMTLASIAKLELALGADILFQKPIYATGNLLYKSPETSKNKWSTNFKKSEDQGQKSPSLKYKVIKGGLAA